MKVVHLFSGGLDSTVALHQLIAEGHELRLLAIDYGQRHRKELDFANSMAKEKAIELKQLSFPSIRELLSGSSQTSDELGVPEGHYTSENMKLTVVPNRNMIMLSIAIGWAVSLKFDAVCYAAHAGDHTIYPDCRPEFAHAVDQLAQICDWHPVKLLRPFIELSKSQIVRKGAELEVPFERTWSCYKGLDKHCGKCGTCVERQEAFEIARIVDPTSYEQP
ncbi:MAG: 7-cyano-7-deazaguanine synthase QueC [Deltaproteobacteria bacterium CG11_big_fil_rev_8_21_14_0_20_45_16]|nr:MAG: 7-cyano-7-deazaguanine synthase QueC [Deltaproteobacteria bacterium CG11_big_fil_rev_8_21_14_0_20_45_16]